MTLTDRHLTHQRCSFLQESPGPTCVRGCVGAEMGRNGPFPRGATVQGVERSVAGGGVCQAYASLLESEDPEVSLQQRG